MRDAVGLCALLGSISLHEFVDGSTQPAVNIWRQVQIIVMSQIWQFWKVHAEYIGCIYMLQ